MSIDKIYDLKQIKVFKDVDGEVAEEQEELQNSLIHNDHEENVDQVISTVQ